MISRLQVRVKTATAFESDLAPRSTPYGTACFVISIERRPVGDQRQSSRVHARIDLPRAMRVWGRLALPRGFERHARTAAASNSPRRRLPSPAADLLDERRCCQARAAAWRLTVVSAGGSSEEDRDEALVEPWSGSAPRDEHLCAQGDGELHESIAAVQERHSEGETSRGGQ